MRFKGTAALFLAFVVLGGYVYFTEFRGKEERQKQEEAKKKVSALLVAKYANQFTATFPQDVGANVAKAYQVIAFPK